MGTEGAKGGPAAASMAQRLVEEFATLGPVESKKMFGGFGLFCESVMFALVDTEGTAFLRAEDARHVEAMGTHKHGRMPYWSIPAPVLDDREQLIDWAKDALTVARAAKKR